MIRTFRCRAPCCPPAHNLPVNPGRLYHPTYGWNNRRWEFPSSPWATSLAWGWVQVRSCFFRALGKILVNKPPRRTEQKGDRRMLHGFAEYFFPLCEQQSIRAVYTHINVYIPNSCATHKTGSWHGKSSGITYKGNIDSRMSLSNRLGTCIGVEERIGSTRSIIS